ncbi:MAG: amidohydrolase family protein [Clostridia bacterium]
MKIIDTHVHYGKISSFNMPLEDILVLIKSRNIDAAVISSIENAEIYEGSLCNDSITNNACLLDEIKDDDRLYMQYWIKPNTERMNDGIAYFIENNRNKIIGLKIHPFLSGMCITDDRIRPYLDYAKQIRLPVSVHTAKGYGCECRYLASVCEKYPKVDFIAVHMDLGTDHKEAVELINGIPNLYGDVSWIKYSDYLDLGVSPGKVMFGSDIPINMDTAYDFYEGYFINKNREKGLMMGNALKLFPSLK